MDSQTKKMTGRNDPCHCGSGKKYKNCHLDADERAAREARSKAAESAPKAEVEAAAAPAAPAGASGAPGPRPKAHSAQPWKRTAANTRGFQRTSATRKVGGGG